MAKTVTVVREIDDRTDKMSDAALNCRAERRHPTVTLAEAIKAELKRNRELRNLRVLELARECLNGCGVVVYDTLNLLTGEKAAHSLDYRGCRDDRGNDTYLSPDGRVASDDARVALFARLLG